MTKRIITLIMVIAMIFTAVPLSVAAEINFDDVEYGHWAYSHINSCYSSGIMKGTSATTFSPDGTMTVAEIITVAVRLSGKTVGQTGKNWYDSAVDMAKKEGIIKEGQFDSYDRAATRAEVAGMLAVSRNESEYEAINTVYVLPDVDESTPYSQEIFKLYRAGILTGSDTLGTFYPYNNISRAEVSALINRLINKTWRQENTYLIPPGDMVVKTTGRRINIGGVWSYGVVEIGGKYFVPSEVFDIFYKNAGLEVKFSEYSDSYNFNVNEGEGVAYQLDYSFAMPEGIVMGTAQPSDKRLWYNRRYYSGAVYVIDGRFPMVSLEALGARQEGNDFVIPTEKYPTAITMEEDIVGNRLCGLQRQTVADTLRAIHDYIVNTLMYDPNVAAPSNITQEKLDAAYNDVLWANESYMFRDNATFAAGYGVCEDYARLFLHMCLRSGIPCIMVTGMANGIGGMGGHAWNMVYINNEWQFVDTTWDDPVDNVPTLSHSYYLIGTEKLAMSHIWDGFPMPDEYDPAWEQLDINNITSADMFRKCLVAQLVMGKEEFTLRGVYGGVACIYNYELYFWQIGYTYKNGGYHFTVKYF